MRFGSCSLVLAMTMALAPLGCESDPMVGVDEAALTQPTRVIINDDGRFTALEGSECLSYFPGGDKHSSGAWVAPSWVGDATIIYNGFSHRYLSSDHHVRRVQGDITGVSFGADHVLRWTFNGTLDDNDLGDSGMELCYFYTVIGWDPADVQARSQVGFGGIDLDYDGATTSMGWRNVMSAQNQLPDCPFAASEPVAVLPRGSTHQYRDGLSGLTDHHLFQIAYSQTQDQNPGNCVTFSTSSVLRDKNADDDAFAAGRASLLGGLGVAIRASDFVLTSRAPNYNQPFPTATGAERVEHVVVQGLPYSYALPMLTGWELYYKSGSTPQALAGDQHVTRMGASIRNLRYDRVKGALEYDFFSVLGDQNMVPGHESRRNVAILGLTRTPTTVCCFELSPTLSTLAP